MSFIQDSKYRFLKQDRTTMQGKDKRKWRGDGSSSKKKNYWTLYQQLGIMESKRFKNGCRVMEEEDHFHSILMIMLDPLIQNNQYGKVIGSTTLK